MIEIVLVMVFGAIIYPLLHRVWLEQSRLVLPRIRAELSQTGLTGLELNRAVIKHYEQRVTRKALLMILVTVLLLPFLLGL